MKNTMFDFTPSIYQNDIFDWVKHGTGNAVIRAYAGSGKTSTIVNAIKLIPKKRSCLFIAFNNSIVNELKEKLMDYPNCKVMTIHSLGSSIIRKNFSDDKINLDEYKYRNYLKQNIQSLSEIDLETITKTVFDEYIESVSSLINYTRFNLCQNTEEIREIANRYSIPILYDECEVAKKCLKWGKNHLDSIDYTDMVWLPYELGLSPSGYQFDWVFFDEAQDASKAYVDLFIRTFKRGTRFCAVGDSFQTINLFAGSSSEAFDYISSYPNTHVFDLPICYRCDRKIVELSQTMVPGIQYRPEAGNGVILEDCHLSEVKPGDMILCRSKSPLAKLYIRLIENGVNCYIKGSDYGRNLIDLIETVGAKELGKELLTDGLFIQLYRRLIESRNNVMSSHNLDIWDASLSMKVMALYDEINILLTISKGCSTIEQLIQKIETIFREDSEGICLSTIHKAKGLEANNVYIICRSTMPPKRATKDWEKTQEQNLIYVAYTRAKHKLGFIDEKEVPPAGSSMTDEDVVNDIAFIEKQVYRVLGIPLTEDNNSADFAKFRLKAVTNIEDKHANDNVFVIKNESETPDEEISLEYLLKQLD